MKKEISVNTRTFSFQFREDSKFWYLGSEEVDIFNLGYPINITINGEKINWQEVEMFLQFITSDNFDHKEKCQKANNSLKVLFKELHFQHNPNLNYDKIYFTLCNIDYKGSINRNDKTAFQYVFNFNLESSEDSDLFSYESWNASFLGEDFVGVSKS